MVIKEPNTRTLGLSWPTITRQIQLTCIQTTTSMQQRGSLKTRSYTVRFTLKNFCYLKLATHFMHSKKLTNKIQKNSLENKKDLGMTCHTPPLKKVKKQGEMPLPSLTDIPSLNSAFF